jgi:hypothetical protein
LIVGLRWYAIGTVSTYRPKQAEGFRHISVKLQQKPTTYCIQEANDSPQIQTHWHLALHSYASNPRNAQCSRSVPSITVSTLVSYVTFLSLIIFKIIAWPCLLPFHCKSLFHILFYIAYYHLLTIAALVTLLVLTLISRPHRH